MAMPRSFRCFGVDSDPMREDLPSTFAKYRAAADKLPHRMQISAILAGTDNCWKLGSAGFDSRGQRKQNNGTSSSQNVGAIPKFQSSTEFSPHR